MTYTVAELAASYIVVITGFVLIVFVFAFVLRTDFMNAVLRPSRKTGKIKIDASASGVGNGKIEIDSTGTFFIAIMMIFLIALIAMLYFLMHAPKNEQTAQQLEKARNDAYAAQQRLIEEQEKSEKFRKEIGSIKKTTIKAFYIGEYDRAPVGRRYYCGTPIDNAAKEVCGKNKVLSISVIGSSDGNKCGYTYYATACSDD